MSVILPTTANVAAILPFWRYAVVPESKCSPGLPFWREAAAREFFEEAQTHLPWATVFLLKKPWYSGKFEVIDYYEGSPISHERFQRDVACALNAPIIAYAEQVAEADRALAIAGAVLLKLAQINPVAAIHFAGSEYSLADVIREAMKEAGASPENLS